MLGVLQVSNPRPSDQRTNVVTTLLTFHPPSCKVFDIYESCHMIWMFHAISACQSTWCGSLSCAFTIQKRWLYSKVLICLLFYLTEKVLGVGLWVFMRWARMVCFIVIVFCRSSNPYYCWGCADFDIFYFRTNSNDHQEKDKVRLRKWEGAWNDPVFLPAFCNLSEYTLDVSYEAVLKLCRT